MLDVDTWQGLIECLAFGIVDRVMRGRLLVGGLPELLVFCFLDILQFCSIVDEIGVVFVDELEGVSLIDTRHLRVFSIQGRGGVDDLRLVRIIRLFAPIELLRIAEGHRVDDLCLVGTREQRAPAFIAEFSSFAIFALAMRADHHARILPFKRLICVIVAERTSVFRRR